MSILIKGMEMPKNCYGCFFFKQVDYWNKDDEADILSKCKRTGEFTWESVNGYLPNCPLVPVPPHGRLIDADALAEHKFVCIPHVSIDGKEVGSAYRLGWNTAIEAIMENAETIVGGE